MYNELHGEFITQVTAITEIFIVGSCFYWFAKPFMENTKQAVRIEMAYFLTMLIIRTIPAHVNHFVAYSTAVFAAFLMMCWSDRRNYRQKVFIAVTFFALRWFNYAMAQILYDHLYAFAERTQYMANHLNLWLALYICMCLFYLGMEFLFTVISIGCILKVYSYKHENMAAGELVMLSIPFIAGVAGCEIIWYYRNFYGVETGTFVDAYDLLAFLYSAVSMITLVVVIGLYQRIKAKQEENLQNELLAAQIDSIRQHIEQVESLYQNIRGIRHDMTNHILTLERLYAGNQTEEARAYGTDLKTALAEVTGELKSGNPVTDVILQESKNRAEKKGIRFCCDFHYPPGSTINAFDVSVILNNALQNALENAGNSDTPYISILSYRRNNAYMIEVSNSFTGDLQRNTQSGLPVTSKEKTNAHGYGLSNIRKVAGKYGGDLVIDVEDGEFRLSVMLMLE